MKIMAKLFLVSGSSRLDKSIILPYLKNKLRDGFDIHDFDERLTTEVAMNSSLLDGWRKETTRYWIELAKENNKLGKKTVVLGLIYPSEVREFSGELEFNVCLLDANDEKIKERLMGNRFSNSHKVDGLKQATGKTPEEFIEENKILMQKLRVETAQVEGKIIDTTDSTPEQTADKLLISILEN